MIYVDEYVVNSLFVRMLYFIEALAVLKRGLESETSEYAIEIRHVVITCNPGN